MFRAFQAQSLLRYSLNLKGISHCGPVSCRFGDTVRIHNNHSVYINEVVNRSIDRCHTLSRGPWLVVVSVVNCCVFSDAPGFSGVFCPVSLQPGLAGHEFDTTVRARCRRVGRNARTPPPLLSHFLVLEITLCQYIVRYGTNTAKDFYSVGGCHCRAIHSTRASTTYSLLRRSANTVARPIAVRPTMCVPPFAQARCSPQE